jgi:hypothetical protein
VTVIKGKAGERCENADPRRRDVGLTKNGHPSVKLEERMKEFVGIVRGKYFLNLEDLRCDGVGPLRREGGH